MPPHIACKPISQIINLARISHLEHKFDAGCDINDEIGPFNDAVELEGELDFEEIFFPDVHLLKVQQSVMGNRRERHRRIS